MVHYRRRYLQLEGLLRFYAGQGIVGSSKYSHEAIVSRVGSLCRYFLRGIHAGHVQESDLRPESLAIIDLFGDERIGS